MRHLSLDAATRNAPNPGAAGVRGFPDMKKLVLLAMVMLLSPAAANAQARDRHDIHRVIRAVAIAGDRKDYGLLWSVTWPEGTFSIRTAGQPASTAIARSWRDFIFAGVGVQTRTRLGTPIIAIARSRATVSVTETGRFLYFGGTSESGFTDSGSGFVAHDRITLERRSGQWRVLNWSRAVRNTGSDAAWRRRSRR